MLEEFSRADPNELEPTNPHHLGWKCKKKWTWSGPTWPSSRRLSITLYIMKHFSTALTHTHWISNDNYPPCCLSSTDLTSIFSVRRSPVVSRNSQLNSMHHSLSQIHGINFVLHPSHVLKYPTVGTNFWTRHTNLHRMKDERTLYQLRVFIKSRSHLAWWNDLICLHDQNEPQCISSISTYTLKMFTLFFLRGILVHVDNQNIRQEEPLT
jgi:hypothetical protein